MQTNASKLDKLYDMLTWWADTGKPPVRGCTLSDYYALWDLGEKLQQFHRAETFIERAVLVLRNCGFRTEATEVGWSIYDD